MTIKDQVKTVKENWLIALLLLLTVLLPLFGSTTGYSLDFVQRGMNADYALGKAAESSYYEAAASSYYPSPLRDGFAPEIEERKITTYASLTSEIERGTFREAEGKVKDIIGVSNSIVLSENIDTYDVGRKSYLQGYYTLKVDTQKYNTVITQLKEIGEIKSFNENRQDITESYTILEVELAAEKSRLERFMQMLAEATEVADKIELNDRIFNQERTIKYLEDALRNQDQQVEYSTISVQLQEKRSEYADIAVLKFSELIASLVSSFNHLLQLLFVALPYALVLGVLWLVVRAVRKK